MTKKSAIILCGGLGTRLQSVVHNTPKCLAPIQGIPFLYYLFQQLKDWDEVILSIGHLSQQVVDYAKSVANEFSFDIKYAEEKEPLGTGGAIAFACKFSSAAHCIVLNGDTYYNISLENFLHAHLQSGAALSLALQPMEQADRYGLVEIEEDTQRIMAFKEKQIGASGLINAGIYAMPVGLVASLHLPEKFSFEKDVMEPNLEKLYISGIIADAYFIDIGVPEDYARGQVELPRLLDGE